MASIRRFGAAAVRGAGTSNADLYRAAAALLGLACARDSHEVVRQACLGAQLLTSADEVALLEWRDGVMSVSSSVGGDPDDGRLLRRLAEDAGSPAARACQTGRRQLARQVLEVSPARRAGAARSCTLLAEPVRDEDGVLAVLVLVDRREGTSPTPTSGLLPMFAAAVAVALRRATELHQLRSSATSDALTGLPARAAFRRSATAVLTRCAWSQRPVSLLVGRLEPRGTDGRRGGHRAGDRAVLATAERWRSVLRPHDLLARHGADGFVVLLPDVDAAQAPVVGSRLTASCQPVVELVVGAASSAADADLDELLDRALHDLSRRLRESRQD